MVTHASVFSLQNFRSKIHNSNFKFPSQSKQLSTFSMSSTTSSSVSSSSVSSFEMPVANQTLVVHPDYFSDEKKEWKIPDGIIATDVAADRVKYDDIWMPRPAIPAKLYKAKPKVDMMIASQNHSEFKLNTLIEKLMICKSFVPLHRIIVTTLIRGIVWPRVLSKIKQIIKHGWDKVFFQFFD